MGKKMLWVILPVVTVLSTVTTVLALDTSSALYTSNLLFLNLGTTKSNFAIAEPISGSAMIDDGFMAADTLNAVIHEGPNQIPGMPPNNRIVVEGAVVDDGGSFTEFTAEAQDAVELDVALLPASPAVDDAAYFGCDNPCRIVTVDIGQEGIGDWTVKWEYYNGTAFVTASNVDDRTNAFQLAGQRTVSFDMPTDFATSTITGSAVDAFWVRARVDSVSTSSQQAIANQEWYENGQWWMWGDSLSINEQILYNMSVGGPDLVTHHQIFPGDAGIITPDDASIELGDSYQVHWEGAVSFVTGSDVACILCKGTGGTSPFQLFVSDIDTNEITLSVTGSGNTTLSISGLPDATAPITGVAPHTIDVVSDGTNVTLTVAGLTAASGDAQDITDIADDYVWMNNSAATYANVMYFFPDELGFAATVIDTEAEWDTGAFVDQVSTGGQAAWTTERLSEASADDGYWLEGTSAFNNTDDSTQFGYNGGGGATSANAFYRFDNLIIEQGATITSASLTATPFTANAAATVNVAINGVDADDPAAPSTYAAAEALTRTTATVAWSAVSSFVLNSPVTSPDIATIIQEIVDRPGWASGNGLVILVEDSGSTAAGGTTRAPSAFEGHSTAMSLTIEVDTGEVFTDDFIELDTVDISASVDVVEGWTGACSGGSCFSGSTYDLGATDRKAVFGLTGWRLSGNSSIGNLGRITSDPVAAVAGETWSFSTYAYRATAGSGCTTSLIVIWRDAGSVALSLPSVTFPVDATSYQLVELNGEVAPATAATAELRVDSLCTGSTGSQVYLDGAMAAEAATAPAFGDSSNALVNPSFEQILEPTGTWISPSISLTATDVASSLVIWDGFGPFDATITAETSIDSQASWQSVTNGGAISGIALGDDVSGGTLNVRFTLATSTDANPVLSPWVSLVAVVVADDVSEEDTILFYQLRTTPGVTIEDLSPNSNDGTMSYPVQLSGVFTDITPLVTTRTPLSQQAAIGAGEFAAPVTGSAAALNLFGQDDGSFLPGGDALANAAAQAGFPVGALWASIVMIIGVVAGAVAYRLTAPNQWPASVVLAATVVIAAALGEGIVPGWVPVVTIMMLVSWNLLRSRLPI